MISKIRISHLLISSTVLVVFFSIVLLLWGSIMYMKLSINAEQTAITRKEEFKQLGIELSDASDYLTDQARKFAVTNNIVYMNKYWQEINVTKTRDKVIYKIIESNAPATELSLLAEAKKNSDGLVETEKRSMRLVLDALGIAEEKMQPEVADFKLSSEEEKLSKDEKLAKAREIMFDNKYDSDKKTIMDPIKYFQTSINNRSEVELNLARKARMRAEVLQIILAFVIIFMITIVLRIMFEQFTIPVKNYTEALLDLHFNNRNFRLIPEGSCELKMLAATFNKMYCSLQDELIKRKKAEKTMKKAKEEAELANKAKSEFLANMSHEIRTPLNAIIGYEYMLRNTSITPKQEEYSDRIGISAKNLLGIINNILDFSKIEAKKLIIESVSFDIYNILNELSSMVYFEVKRKGLKFDFYIHPEVPRYLKGDPIRLKQVILNIVSNGIKFTKKGGIDIDVRPESKSKDFVVIRFSITDSGIGISEEQKISLFEPFVQADASTTRKYGGTGLGLAISKEIVQLMDGKIYIKSKIGEGSTFCFTAKFEIGNKVLTKRYKLNNIYNYKLFKGKKILLVEDNEINREMTKEILQNLGFDADTANSGILAVKKVKNNRYDVVLMDIQMPKMDGYETTRRIRALKDNESIPIIALSADVVKGVSSKVKECRMNAYMTKPLDVEKLINTLKNFVDIEIEPFNNKYEKNLTQQDYLDFHNAIERIGGNGIKYKDILKQFICNHSDDDKKLYEYISLRNWKELKAFIHTIKGISGNIGANRLKTICETMEKSIISKDENKLMYLKNNFKLALENVVKCASEFIVIRLDKEVTKGECGSEKSTKHENIENVLSKLLDFLQYGDAEAKSFFISSEDCLKKELKYEDYSGLRKKILSYNFEDAAQDLRKIVNIVK